MKWERLIYLSAVLIALVAPESAHAIKINIALHNGSGTFDAMDPANTPAMQGSFVNTSEESWNNIANNGGEGLNFSGVGLSALE